MAASEGSRTPLTREEEDEAYTPGPARTAPGRSGSGVTPPDASESSPTSSAPDSRTDDERPVSHRDLARTRRAIGVSLKSMHEDFSKLLAATQEECAKRVDSLTQVLSKDREVTANLIQAEAQKREELKEQLMGYIHFPTPGDASGPAPPAVLHDMGPDLRCSRSYSTLE